MPIYIALLRGINVGGHKQIAMADLRAMLEQLGFVEPRTLLQSGNLVFRSEKERKNSEMEQLLESETKKRLHVEVSFMVRTLEEWDHLISHNPFSAEAKRDPSHLLVVCFKEVPSAKQVEALQAAIMGPEVVHFEGSHAYIVYPDGIGRSKLTSGLIEKTLGVRATGRNWNTVLKLKELTSKP